MKKTPYYKKRRAFYKKNVRQYNMGGLVKKKKNTKGALSSPVHHLQFE